MNSQRSGCLMVLMVLVMAVMVTSRGVHAVPKRVANRMVPSWWSTAKNVCWSGSDCMPGECCARPMLSSKSYCMPLRNRGQVCDASPLMLNFADGIYFSDCPCQMDLTCASLSNKAKAQCVDLRTLEIDYRRLAAMSIPPPNENH